MTTAIIGTGGIGSVIARQLASEDALAAHPPKATFMDMNVPGWEMRHAVID